MKQCSDHSDAEGRQQQYAALLAVPYVLQMHSGAVHMQRAHTTSAVTLGCLPSSAFGPPTVSGSVPARSWVSTGLTELECTRTSTCPGPRFGTGWSCTSCSTSGPPVLFITTACMLRGVLGVLVLNRAVHLDLLRVTEMELVRVVSAPIVDAFDCRISGQDTLIYFW
jgi:hypothetical protein